jgi:paraquat-inducible protein A
MPPAVDPPADPLAAHTAVPTAALLGCPFCDALNRLPAGIDEPRCWRCDSPLDAVALPGGGALDSRLSAVLALLAAAWVSLFAAHYFPLVALELQGQHNAVSLAGAVATLWNEGRQPLAAALFVTLVAAPLGEAAAMLIAVVGLHHRGRGPTSRWLLAALHVWQALRHWNLTEVLILAAGVALVKLGELATLVIGPALVALMAFMVLRLIALRLLPPERAWPLLEATA